MDISLRSRSFKEKRQRHLLRGLSALRVEEKADITLICMDKSFPAHKLVLEASSPYFVNMFAKGGEELGKTRRIVFNTMEPDTLEAIMDFIYLGSTDTITTEEQVKKVSIAANLMQLVQLAYYCCDALVSRIRRDNYIQLWEIASKCNHSELKEKVLSYASDNFEEIYGTGEFLSLSHVHLTDFFEFAKGKVPVVDRMVDCALKWLAHDIYDRENWADDLLACFDAKFVSKVYIASVLKDESVMNSSVPIANSINKLAVAVFLYDHIQHEEAAPVRVPQCPIKDTLSVIVLHLSDGFEKGAEYCKTNYQDYWQGIQKAFLFSFLLFVFVSICTLKFTGVLLWLMGFVGGAMVFRQEISEAKSCKKGRGLK